MAVADIVKKAQQAKRIKAVKALRLETCVTLGMLKPGQA